MSAWDRAWPILLDKGLLGIVSLGVAYFFARRLEAHKRKEALALELGKARAQALVKISSKVMHNLNMLKHGLLASEAGNRVFGFTDQELLDSLDELRQVLGAESFMLTPAMRDAVNTAWRLVTDAFALRRAGKPLPADFTDQFSRVSGILRDLFPAFELPE